MSGTLHIDDETARRIDEAHRAEREATDEQLAREIAEHRAEIPTNAEVIAMIPSRAERAYLQKLGWQFSERDRLLLRKWFAPKSTEEQELLWQKGCYVSVPYPFRSGDLVTLAGNLHCDVGVFASCIDDADLRRQEARLTGRLFDSLDFSDTASTRVEFLREDGTFDHDHPSAFELEYAELADGDPRAVALTIAAELLRGTRSSVEALQMHCKEYAERGADAAEDIITRRAADLDRSFAWTDERRAALDALEAALEAKELAVFDAVRAEAARVCAQSGHGSATCGNSAQSVQCAIAGGSAVAGDSTAPADAPAPAAAEHCEIHGALVFADDGAALEQALGLEYGVIRRMQERAGELYTADFDTSYDTPARYDAADRYDKKALSERHPFACAGRTVSLCTSLDALVSSRAFALQDLLALPDRAFCIQVTTTRVFR